MRLKMLLTVLVLGAIIPALCQVAPQASETRSPLSIGVGYSNYGTDWSGRLSGPVIWIDWNFYERTSFLRGFGIEAEARDLNYDRTGTTPNLRMDTAAGGLKYTWRSSGKFRPYGKFLVGLGSIDFITPNPNYKHDTRTIYSPGVGLEYRLFSQVWMRGNYEYQFWPDLFHQHSLNPQGFTIGASYDFREFHRRNGL